MGVTKPRRAASACGVLVRRAASMWECHFMIQSYLTKCYKSIKCCYNVLQSVTNESNFVTKCYKSVKCCCKMLQKCQMLLQSVTKCYKSVKCCYKVLQSVTNVSNVVTKCYKVLQKCQMLLQSVTKVSIFVIIILVFFENLKNKTFSKFIGP